MAVWTAGGEAGREGGREQRGADRSDVLQEGLRGEDPDVAV